MHPFESVNAEALSELPVSTVANIEAILAYHKATSGKQ
jgi:hypothetical protein